jgi:hypothetical protein
MMSPRRANPHHHTETPGQLALAGDAFDVPAAFPFLGNAFGNPVPQFKREAWSPKSLIATAIPPRRCAITHADVQRWISGLSANGSVRKEGKGPSASRVIQTHQCMSAVLKYAIRTDRLTKNVANAIELPRKVQTDQRSAQRK